MTLSLRDAVDALIRAVEPFPCETCGEPLALVEITVRVLKDGSPQVVPFHRFHHHPPPRPPALPPTGEPPKRRHLLTFGKVETYHNRDGFTHEPPNRKLPIYNHGELVGEAHRRGYCDEEWVPPGPMLFYAGERLAEGHTRAAAFKAALRRELAAFDDSRGATD